MTYHRKRSPTCAQTVHGREQTLRVLDLRKQHWTQREIGKELGISHQAVGKLLKRAIEDLRKECDEGAEEVRQVELQRLDEMGRKVWEKAKEGELSSVGTMLKIQARRAHYLGLDAPQQLDVTARDAERRVYSWPDNGRGPTKPGEGK